MKRSLATAVALSATLVLGACGSSGDTKTSETTAGGAGGQTSQTSEAPKTEDAPKVGTAVPAKELAEQTTAALKKAGTVKMKITSAGQTMTGEMDYSKDAPAFHMAGGTGKEAMDLVYIDKTFYMGGESFKEMTGGKKYLKISPDGTDMMSKMMAPLLKTMEQAANPAAMFSLLDGVQAKVLKSEGGNTTYSMTITAEQLKKATEKLLGGGTLPPEAAAKITASTVEQTVDSEGRLVSVKQTGGGDAGNTTVEYSDYGVPVDVKAPAASEVGTAQM